MPVYLPYYATYYASNYASIIGLDYATIDIIHVQLLNHHDI